MRRSVSARLAAALVLLLLVAVAWRPTKLQPRAAVVAARGSAVSAAVDFQPQARFSSAAVSRRSGIEGKAARVENIKRDYDAIRFQVLTAYGVEGEAFSGGSDTLMRQLALLERERRVDLAAVLTPSELEELELRESRAGRLVTRLLGATNANEEQRRAVFRLQRDFELRYDFVIDAAPQMFFERELARQQLQEQIRLVLGETLFGTWLAGEGDDYALAAEFAASHGLPSHLPGELRRAKNEFTLQTLELGSRRDMPVEQLRAAQLAVTRQTEARALALLGPALFRSARSDLLAWLPRN